MSEVVTENDVLKMRERGATALEQLAAIRKIVPDYVKCEGQTDEFPHISASYLERLLSSGKVILYPATEPVIDKARDLVVKKGLWEPQRLVLESLSAVVMFIGGLGSGKTFIGLLWVLLRSLCNNGVPSWALALDNSLSDRHHVDGLIDLLESIRFKPARTVARLKNRQYHYHGRKRMFTIKIGSNTARIICKGVHDSKKLVGDSICAVWYDEAFLMHPNVYRNATSRMRVGVFNQQLLTGTPDNLGWAKDLAQGNEPFVETNPFVVVAPTISNGKLDDPFHLRQLSGMTDREVRAYYFGQFVNLQAGIMYYGYDETTAFEDDGDTMNYDLMVGMDFNVNPMSAVCGSWKRGHLHIFKVLLLPNSNTDEMCREIKALFPGRRINVCPDPSGRGRHSNAPIGVTDISILEAHGFNVLSLGGMSRRDSVTAVNQALQHKRLSFWKPGTKALVSSLEFLTWEQKESEYLNKDHVADALKYLVRFLIPPQRGGVGEIRTYV